MDQRFLKEEGLIALVLDSCVNGITLSDPNAEDNPIVYVNEAFERMTGYREEEILGRNCRFLQGSDRNQENIAKIREAIQDKRPISAELKNYKKSDELFYNYLTVSPIFNKDRKLIYFLGVQLDITKQVLAAEELRRLNELLENYIRQPLAYT